MTCNSKVVMLHKGEKVVFDPFNAKHRSLFRKVLVSGNAEYEASFKLEHGFTSVRELMLTKMALAGARLLDAQAWGQTRESILQSFRK